MDSDLTRRRLLASAGLALSAGVASAAGATGADGVEQPSDRSQDPLPVRWNRVYGPEKYNAASSLLETADGNLVALGSATKEQYAEGSNWLFSLDRRTGDGRWSHRFERSEKSLPLMDVAAADDGFVLLGVASFGGQRFSLRKVTTEGKRQWRETYEPKIDAETAQFRITGLQSVGDGYLVCGYVGKQTETTTAETADALVVKVDAEGVEQWRHRFFQDRLAAVQTVSVDGDGYVASGVMQQPPESEDDQPPLKSLAFRFDGSGSVTWRTELVGKTDGETNQSSQVRDHALTESGLLLVGSTGRRFSGKPWVVALDMSGSVRAMRTHQPKQSGKRITLQSVAGDGDTYYAAGSTSSEGSEGSAAWLGSFDTKARLGWSVSPARKQTNAFADVVATDDGGVAVAGHARTEDENAEKPGEAWLVKLGGDTVATPTPSPTPTPTPSPTPTPTPTPSPTPTPTPTATAEPTDPATEPGTAAGEAGTTSSDGPGFGVAGALAALGGGALLRRVRSDGEDDAAE